MNFYKYTYFYIQYYLNNILINVMVNKVHNIRKGPSTLKFLSFISRNFAF